MLSIVSEVFNPERAGNFDVFKTIYSAEDYQNWGVPLLQ